MKIFARIDNKQVGPFGLGELLEAGVRPSTFVWHKGMEDWERAEDVPEVCRAMRRALAGFDPITGELIASADINNQGNQPVEKSPEELMKEEMQARAEGLRGIRNLPETEIPKNYDIRPQGVSVIGAILATVLCFPLTGLVAIWYAMKCRTHWKMSEDKNISSEEASALRRSAHDDARIYRMMMGITFCLGIIMVGFTLSRMTL